MTQRNWRRLSKHIASEAKGSEWQYISFSLTVMQTGHGKIRFSPVRSPQLWFLSRSMDKTAAKINCSFHQLVINLKTWVKYKFTQSCLASIPTNKFLVQCIFLEHSTQENEAYEVNFYVEFRVSVEVTSKTLLFSVVCSFEPSWSPVLVSSSIHP